VQKNNKISLTQSQNTLRLFFAADFVVICYGTSGAIADNNKIKLPTTAKNNLRLWAVAFIL
jgi:hypothetical protein